MAFFSLAFTLCLLCVTVTACGIEDYAFLYPPGASKTGAILQFTNNTANDPDLFMGFKVLYKFCSSSANVDSTISYVETLFANYPTNIYTKMLNYGFDDLKISGESSSLVIASADREETFTVMMDFTAVFSGSGDDVIMTIDPTTISTDPSLASGAEIYRSVSGQSNVGFSYDELDVSLGYDDLGSNYDSSDKTYLLLYVLAYGIDQTSSSFSTVYSEPQYFSATTKYIELSVKR